jgi:hypothetical protein
MTNDARLDEHGDRLSSLETDRTKIAELNGSIVALAERIKNLDERVADIKGIWLKLTLTLLAGVGLPVLLERLLP